VQALQAKGSSMSAVSYQHLSIDESGVARVGGSRYKVVHLAAEHFHFGWSAKELLRQHTDLRPEEVYAALTYFYDHFDQLVSEMDQQTLAAERLRGNVPWSRDELLKRRQREG
jgi:uncharacterized protein (DUF433 family)